MSEEHCQEINLRHNFQQRKPIKLFLQTKLNSLHQCNGIDYQCTKEGAPSLILTGTGAAPPAVKAFH